MIEVTVSPVPILFLLSTLALVLLGIYVLIHRRLHWTEPLSKTLLLVLFGAILWAGPYGIHLMVESLQWKVFWFNLTHIGPSIVVLGFLLHVSVYTGHYRRLTRPLMALLAIEPTITTLLVITEQSHSLLRTSVDVVTIGTLSIVHRGVGPWWQVRLTYLYVLIILTFLLVIVTYRNTDGELRRQIQIASVAIALPVVVNLLFDFQFFTDFASDGLVANVELTGAMLGITGLMLTSGVIQYRSLDLIPIGRRVAIDNVGDPYLLLDDQFRILDCNARFHTITGTGTEAIGQSVSTLLPELEPLLFDEGVSIGGEIAIELSAKRWYHVQIVPLVTTPDSIWNRSVAAKIPPSKLDDHDDQPTKRAIETDAKGYVVTFRDITAQRNEVSELESVNEQLQMLNQLVSHDIVNEMSLSVMIGENILEHLEEDNAEHSEEIEAYIMQIADSNDRVIELSETARDVVDALTDMGGSIEPVSLGPILEEEVFATMSRKDVEVTLADDHPDVTVKANWLLGSVFRNLLTNAVDHNDRDKPKVTVRTAMSDEICTVEIVDNGPGIPEQLRNEIFDDGSYESEHGWGIGLSLVCTLVDEYDGTFRLTDNEYGGTTATVELQVVEH